MRARFGDVPKVCEEGTSVHLIHTCVRPHTLTHPLRTHTHKDLHTQTAWFEKRTFAIAAENKDKQMSWLHAENGAKNAASSAKFVLEREAG